MNSSFRNLTIAAGIALLVCAAGCSSNSPSNTDSLAQQQKDVLGSAPSSAQLAQEAQLKAQGMAYQQQAPQREQQYIQQRQQAQQGAKQ